mgnify:CR=1 FL=1|jgi:Fur family transcriptional regulator, ferric uptake regulator
MMKDEIKKLLRDSGLRATGPRLAVYAAVKAQSHPVSHSQLVKGMQDDDLDAATIYRNLIRLTEVGLLKVVSRANGMARYEQSDSAEKADHDHAHFVCSDCDTVSCLPEAAMTLPKKGDRWSASIKSAQTVIQGTCPDCLN